MIEVVNAGKQYRLYDRPVYRAIEAVGLRRKLHREFWALRNVYLSIDQGACFGVVGRNGAGKSTLLKLISGITKATEGSVTVHGSVSSILELGAGFHHGFTGRDNVFLNCALQGYTRQEAERLLPQIVEFAELGDFIDQQVRTYSTGMVLRLAFAVATSVNPDILIIDEALAVGDERFRAKCMQRIQEFKSNGKTILFVSHDLATVRHLCSHVALLNEGQLVATGRPEEVLDQYLELAHKDQVRETDAPRGAFGRPRWGSGEIQFETVAVSSVDGVAGSVFDTNRAFSVQMDYVVKTPIEDAVFGCQFYRSDGTYLNGSNHFWHDQPQSFSFQQAGEQGSVICQIPCLPLLPGDYYLSVCCYSLRDGVPQAIDHWERAHEFTISERVSDQHGVIAFETNWTLNR
ncbi:MAG: ABC transporter ATP-binding protein [Candidatus Hinthialibacter antarcticus]|nr:ABC transporter ATP-binding protein [Candidatus Hinthialibacter antarcticus]